MRLLVTKWFGVAVVEDGRVVARKDFPRDAHAIAQRLRTVRAGGILEEEKELAGKGVAVTEDRLRPLGTVRPPEPATVDPAGIDAKLLREAAILVARDEFRQSSSEKDRFLVQAVRALDELTKTANTLQERLRDWYGLHYPESVRAITDSATFVQALATAPDRAAVSKRLKAASPDDSIGAPFEPSEIGAVQSFANQLTGLFAERVRLEKVIETEASEVVPTLSSVVGPLIAARLVSHANGLERLAYFPASTVQTLGAENALFLHRREGNLPPKHGVLFQHPLVNTAPRWHRGKMSRVLATHASRAAKLDFFGPSGDRSVDVKAHLEQQVARIRAQKTKPERPHRPPLRGGPPRGGPRGFQKGGFQKRGGGPRRNA